MDKDNHTITVLMPKIIKPKPKYPQCIYSNWYCWQRVDGPNQTYWVKNYGKPDPKECAACLAAHLDWGDGALRRPMHKEEILKEKELYKLKKLTENKTDNKPS
jgi:hypothetical protein